MSPEFGDNKNITRIDGHKKTGSNIFAGYMPSIISLLLLVIFLILQLFWDHCQLRFTNHFVVAITF